MLADRFEWRLRLSRTGPLNFRSGLFSTGATKRANSELDRSVSCQEQPFNVKLARQEQTALGPRTV